MNARDTRKQAACVEVSLLAILETMPNKVFVSGCFDLLHSGHVAFFQQAAAYGDLYVALGADETVYELKGALRRRIELSRLNCRRQI